jgi:hypothetical protein
VVSKNKWRKSEVISFLEYKLQENLASEDEIEMYENYKWFGKLNKNNYTYRSLLKEMNDEYRGE